MILCAFYVLSEGGIIDPSIVESMDPDAKESKMFVSAEKRARAGSEMDANAVRKASLMHTMSHESDDFKKKLKESIGSGDSSGKDQAWHPQLQKPSSSDRFKSQLSFQSFVLWNHRRTHLLKLCVLIICGL